MSRYQPFSSFIYYPHFFDIEFLVRQGGSKPVDALCKFCCFHHHLELFNVKLLLALVVCACFILSYAYKVRVKLPASSDILRVTGSNRSVL